MYGKLSDLTNSPTWFKAEAGSVEIMLYIESGVYEKVIKGALTGALKTLVIKRRSLKRETMQDFKAIPIPAPKKGQSRHGTDIA